MSFRDKYLREYACIGKIRNFQIKVNSDDAGNIPHFHVFCNNPGGNKKNIRCAVRILEADYNLSPNHPDKLNSSFKKELIEFLQSPCKVQGLEDKTNWQAIIICWNLTASAISVDINTPMPNYNLLPNS